MCESFVVFFSRVDILTRCIFDMLIFFYVFLDMFDFSITDFFMDLYFNAPSINHAWRGSMASVYD